MVDNLDGQLDSNPLAQLLYQNHRIVSAAVYDEPTGKWRLTAYVSCLESETPSRRVHFIREMPERFSRVEDAEIAGMEIAKSWVHSHLRELG
jgi:hypothetical protein